MNKSDLRKNILVRRDALSEDFVAASGRRVLEKLIEAGAFRGVRCVFIYVSMKNELPTLDIIGHCLKNNIRVCVPRVEKLTEGQDILSRAAPAKADMAAIALPHAHAPAQAPAAGQARIMKAYEIFDLGKDLAKGHFGVMEPVFAGEEAWKREIFPEEIDVVLMPGSVFDLQGNRIGYGKGFYDSYLANCAHMPMRKIALAYDFQVVDEIFPEKHDVPVDVIFTEKRIIKCGENLETRHE